MQASQNHLYIKPFEIQTEVKYLNTGLVGNSETHYIKYQALFAPTLMNGFELTLSVY